MTDFVYKDYFYSLTSYFLMIIHATDLKEPKVKHLKVIESNLVSYIDLLPSNDHKILLKIIAHRIYPNNFFSIYQSPIYF